MYYSLVMAKQNKEKLAKLFALEYLTNGFNATKAYRAIKPKVTQRTCEVEGSKLLNSPKVKQIISDIRQEQADKHGITLESQIKDLEKYKKLALVGNEKNEPYLTAAIKAVEVQNKMLGLNAPDRIEQTTINYDGADLTIDV